MRKAEVGATLRDVAGPDETKVAQFVIREGALAAPSTRRLTGAGKLDVREFQDGLRGTVFADAHDGIDHSKVRQKGIQGGQILKGVADITAEFVEVHPFDLVELQPGYLNSIYGDLEDRVDHEDTFRSGATTEEGAQHEIDPDASGAERDGPINTFLFPVEVVEGETVDGDELGRGNGRGTTDELVQFGANDSGEDRWTEEDGGNGEEEKEECDQRRQED